MRYGLPLLIMALVIYFFAPAVSAQPGRGQEETVCLGCHDSDMIKAEYRSIPSKWRTSWHYQNGVSCHNCHGGDPRDAGMAMSPERGFTGIPGYAEVPEFCGKCHIEILKNYLEGGHGKALLSTQSGPNCVTCHGSHGIQKADISIINEQRCTQCHTYERARAMKQALFLTEKKIREVEEGIKELKQAGVFTEDQEKTLFNTEAEFRTLFHSVDVSLIKERTDGFTKKLDQIDSQIKGAFRQLLFRKNYALFIMLVFLGIGTVLFMLSRSSE